MDKKRILAKVKAAFRRKAFGLSVRRIIGEEMPKHSDAQEFIMGLYDTWEFQMATDGARHAVTKPDWDSVMSAVKARWPDAETKAFIDSLRWTDSFPHRQALANNYPPPPLGGVA